MCARTLCPFVSSTLNMAFGSASATVPSISIAPSFLAKQYLLIYVGVFLRTSAHFWAEGNLKARSQKEEIGNPFGRHFRPIYATSPCPLFRRCINSLSSPGRSESEAGNLGSIGSRRSNLHCWQGYSIWHGVGNQSFESRSQRPLSTLPSLE